MALPEFQRGYVWNREQVCGLMESLYRNHPVGTLLVWTTQPENAKTRSAEKPAGSPVKLILDGQQRITSLYGIIEGKPPKFFEGNAEAFLDLYFNIDEEVFEFYGPVKMKDNPAWINVTRVMQEGIGDFINRMSRRENAPFDLNTYVNRLNSIVSIKDRDLHIEEVTGQDKTVDVVVDIFNRVNSGGAKLSKGDLIELLRQNRGDLRISPNDFLAWSRGARFYPLLYMLTRVWHAKDWETGVELANHTLGAQSRLQMHHIFAKALLYEHGYEKREVNSLANFTFLTQNTNLKVSDRPPQEYLAEYLAHDASLLESHWIPTDPDLWKLENYELFLEKRRELLAQAANDFLDDLRGGEVPERELMPAAGAEMAGLPGSIDSDAERAQIEGTNRWVQQQGYAPGQISYELSDGDTEMPLALIDLAWPDGLQPGLSEPVALLIDEDQETEELVGRAGFRFFTSPDDLRAYVEQEVSKKSSVF